MSKNEKYKYAKILSFNTLCSPREILISIPYGVDEKDCRIIVSYSDGRQEIIFPECFKTFEVDYLNAFYNIIEMGIPVNNAMYSYIAFGFPEKALGVFKLLDTLYPGFDENGMPIVFQDSFDTATITYEIAGEVVDYQVFPAWALERILDEIDVE